MKSLTRFKRKVLTLCFHFTDETRQCIEVLSLETLQRRVLVTNNVINPMSIAVSPKHALIFWSDWRRESENAVIRKASSNGDNPTDLAFVELSKPTCLTVNSDRELIVWLDRELNTIEMIFFNGMNRKKLLKLEKESGEQVFSLAWLGNIFIADMKKQLDEPYQKLDEKYQKQTESEDTKDASTLFFSDPKSENIEKRTLKSGPTGNLDLHPENTNIDGYNDFDNNYQRWGAPTRRIQSMTTITQKPSFRAEGSCDKCSFLKSLCLQ